MSSTSTGRISLTTARPGWTAICAEPRQGRDRRMATNAKIGLLVPGSFAGTPPTLSEFTAFFRRTDDLGLDSLWVIDRIFHTVNVLDPMTLLTCAAAVTSRVRLG